MAERAGENTIDDARKERLNSRGSSGPSSKTITCRNFRRRKWEGGWGDSVLFRFEGGVGLGVAEIRLIDQVCIDMGYPRGGVGGNAAGIESPTSERSGADYNHHEDSRSVHLGRYLSGEDRTLLDVFPELGYFRDINFMLRLLMVPAGKTLPQLRRWKSTDAALRWHYMSDKSSDDKSHGTDARGYFKVVGFRGRNLSWKKDDARRLTSRARSRQMSLREKRGFLTRIILGKGKRAQRAPSSMANPSHLVNKEIIDEDDVLALEKLPSFGGRLSARKCEVLLQFLTVPYLRIPLVVRWFAEPMQVKLLQVGGLREVLDAALSLVWNPPKGKITTRSVIIIMECSNTCAPIAFDHMVTPSGLLFRS